ncbi:DUF1801 domain-containing protein [Leptospira gomenensis]|uniref:DUF1801 domain-containing protein n=1 Tax=Leptospira gomenensis TaxID=2484974 RepID=A0A5F1Z0Q9_9LEPT|nr:DUF1801 domain-containing protein [Leptospira gomenensis]TGK30995.1 DUF1801 domain-containing protein [Leptospira gomenensis]TGK35618.1 DUF1801 domain-containing protein [Leptospira gomenensis]TGK45285.1 DUF1801 domain-containing protein [Leptospira gomenensis]TGK66199.1 DUF1801 domain-containing protein [Leptospira gomenensis]
MSDDVLRFPGGAKRSSEIDVWLLRQPDELQMIAQRWFTPMRECGEDVRELIHDGHPTACVYDVAFAYVNVFTAHVNVGFFNGSLLHDPAKLLQGTGKRMRHVKLRPGVEVNEKALTELILSAYRDAQKRNPNFF